MNRHIFSKALNSMKVERVNEKPGISNRFPRKEQDNRNNKKSAADSNGKTFADYLEEKRNASQSMIKSSRGFFSYCFDDVDGYCQEFDTLSECRREAKLYSKENPDFEVLIYGMSSMKFVNGKEGV